MKAEGEGEGRGAAEPPGLSRSDYAAVRAYVQGVTVDDIGFRYLAHLGTDGELPDARLVASHVRRCVDALVVRAHQHGLELLAASLLRRTDGSNRAIERAVAAVTELERRGTPSPAPAHPVSMWFAPALAARLQRAQLITVADLVRHCNARGTSWWRSVPRVGVKAAGSVVAWLRQHGAALSAAGGQSLAPHAIDRRAPAADAELVPGAQRVPPWESMRLAAALDGSVGENRGSASAALGARNDYEAVQAWLSRWPAESHTRRAYRKEAERLLAWALIARGKAFSSLTAEDCIAYRDFLSDPQPSEVWCGRMQPRFSPLWRPFTGPLSARSRTYSITVLRSLCEWLTRLRYLVINPFDALPQGVGGVSPMQIDRALSKSAWTAFEAWLRERAGSDGDFRTAHAAILTLRDTGLRRAEMCSADRADAVAVPDVDASVWGELNVVGKGGKQRLVPLSAAAVAALRAHWRDRHEDFDVAPSGPLLRPLRRPATARSAAAAAAGRGFSPTGLHALIARVGARYAAECPDRQELQHLRAHALRHTLGVLGTDAGVPADVLQAIFGHASPTTTSLYNRAPRARRLRETGRLYAAS